jgi:hypothetical protein
MFESINDNTPHIVEKTEFDKIGYLQVVHYKVTGHYCLQFKATILPFFCDECNTDSDANCRCIEREWVKNYLPNNGMIVTYNKEVVYTMYRTMAKEINTIKTMTRRELCKWIEMTFSHIPLEERSYEYGFYIHTTLDKKKRHKKKID